MQIYQKLPSRISNTAIGQRPSCKQFHDRHQRERLIKESSEDDAHGTSDFTFPLPHKDQPDRVISSQSICTAVIHIPLEYSVFFRPQRDLRGRGTTFIRFIQPNFDNMRGATRGTASRFYHISAPFHDLVIFQSRPVRMSQPPSVPPGSPPFSPVITKQLSDLHVSQRLQEELKHWRGI